MLEDMKGNTGLFAPIAVIHHRGEIYGNTTCGHYQADVLDSLSNHWIRTSDDEAPIMISKEEITEEGYIFLYRKKRRYLVNQPNSILCHLFESSVAL